MKKRMVLMLCLLCCFALFIGCGNSDEKESSSNNNQNNEQTTDLSFDYNKVSVWLNGEEYFTTDTDKMALINQVLKSVTIDEEYFDGVEGGYDISLYKDDEVVCRMGLTDKRVIIDGKYVKLIDNDTYETIKSILVELKK